MLFTETMPELPEVETVICELREFLVGKTINYVSPVAPHLKKINNSGFSKKLIGLKVDLLERIGKNIFVNFQDSSLLWIHLRMTGQTLIQKNPDISDPHNHIALGFVQTKSMLVFRDVRKFGQFVFVHAKKRNAFLEQMKVGEDALKISEKRFVELLMARKRMIKALLLDQSLIAGLGNIYVDEILFKCRIHPLKEASRISHRKLREMYHYMRSILKFAIDNMGTTFDSFSNTNGKAGNFQSYLKAYNNAGNLCPHCKKAKIKRIVVVQRGTHICPNCQRIRKKE